jgi:hypothetical protein
MLCLMVCSSVVFGFMVIPIRARELLFVERPLNAPAAKQEQSKNCQALRAAKSKVYGFRLSQLNESQIDAKGKEEASPVCGGRRCCLCAFHAAGGKD